LISEKNPNIAIIISFTAVMLAVFSVVMSVTNNTLVSAISAALMLVALAESMFGQLAHMGVMPR
jgi:hypothetical protein